jgi:hypothetical protein
MNRRIIKRKQIRDHTEVILCELPDNKVTPWATWQRNMITGDTYWGHYHSDEFEAYRDFKERSQSHEHGS